jgi:hypothetical protein
MLFRTRYSQETLECFKSLVNEGMCIKRIKGFISNNRWIYFEPEALHTVSTKKMRTMLGVKTTAVKGEGRRKHTLFAFG